MWNGISTLDKILRGETTRPAELQHGKINAPARGLLFVLAALGIIYGACMGLFSLTPGGSGHAMQLLATTLKVPTLFLLTLLVTFPSLYVFNALVGSRLLLPSVLRLLIASLAVMLAVLSSIGPIVAFFSFTTTSYPFMILLNVAVFTIAGLMGLGFLLQTLHRLTIMSAFAPPPLKLETPPQLPAEPPTDPTAIAAAPPAPLIPTTQPHEPGPLDHSGSAALAPHVKAVFRIWILVFGLVGSQMAWVLRPFIGNPAQPFTWFRHPDSNFFQAVAGAVMKMIS